MGGIRCTAAAALAAFVLAPAAGADWLVTREGKEIETRGPWEVRDRLVVFRLPAGNLASMRLDEVDLEASEALTAEKQRARESPQESSESDSSEGREREPVAVWTDADFSRGSLPPSVTAEAPGVEPGAAPDGKVPEAVADREPLEVTSWDRVDTGEGYVGITGVLENRSETLATGISVTVELIDGEGVKVGEAQAQLSSSSLPPEGRGRFRASFPQIFNFSTARFTVQSQGFDVVSPDATRVDEAAGGEGDTEATEPQEGGSGDGGDHSR